MKFACQSCSAKYVIDDERVRGKILRIRCKKCGETMEVRELERPQQAGPSPFARPAKRATESFSRDALAQALAAPAPEPAAEWHYAINGETFGPYSEDELIERFQSGRIGDTAYVWHQGFVEWRPATEIPVFGSAIRRALAMPSRRGAQFRTQSLSAADLAELQAAAAEAPESLLEDEPDDGYQAQEEERAAERAQAEAAAAAQAAAEKAAAEKAAAEKAAADRAAAERAAADKAAADRAAAEKAAADKAAADKAADEARAQADAEREAHEAAAAAHAQEVREALQAASIQSPPAKPAERPAASVPLPSLRNRVTRPKTSLDGRTLTQADLDASAAPTAPAMQAVSAEAFQLPEEDLSAGPTRPVPTDPAVQTPPAKVEAEAPTAAPATDPLDDAKTPPAGLQKLAAEPPAPRPATARQEAVAPARPPKSKKTTKSAPPAPSVPLSTTSANEAVPPTEAPSDRTADPLDLFDLNVPIDQAPARTVGVPTVAPTPKKRGPVLLLAAVAILALIGIAYWATRPPQTTQTPTPTPTAQREGTAPPTAPATEGSEPAAEVLSAAALRAQRQGIQLAQVRAQRAVERGLSEGIEAVVARLSEGAVAGAVSANRLDDIRNQRIQARNTARAASNDQGSSGGRNTAASEATPEEAPTTPQGGQGLFAELGHSSVTGPAVTPRTGRAEQTNAAATTERFAEGLASFVSESITRCRQRAIAEEGSLPANRVELEIEILPSGRVSTVDPGRLFTGTAFDRCLRTHKDRWNFGPFAGGAITLRRTYILQ